MYTFTKVINDPDRLLAYLRSNGYDADGVSVQGTTVCVCPKMGAGDPTTLMNAYVERDYYDITANKPVVDVNDVGWKAYELKKDGADTVVFTVTRRRAADNVLVPAADVVNIHWHGTTGMWRSASQITLVNGVGTVEIGRNYMPGGGFMEAVHPTEVVQRGAASLKYVY